MSPERPPSQDSGGGNVIEPTNMVLSTIPLESGHVVIQHHQGLIQNGVSNNNINTNGYTTIHHNNSSSQTQNILTTAAATNQTKLSQSIITSSSPSPSKYVVFHQNGNGQYTTTNDSTTTAYLTTTTTTPQTNGVGNIVLVATESMEPSNNQQNIILNTNNDEELTSLTWLHDKNLIKGIVACTNNSNNNNKLIATSPLRQSNGVVSNGVGIITNNNNNNNNNGAISPTSDFLDDSCVSEDNVSSANSNSDQGISIHNSEYSPTIINNNNGCFAQRQQQIGTHQFQQNTNQQQQQQHHIQYTNINNNNNNNNNNNINSKNRNHLLSPTTTTTYTTTSAITAANIQEHLQNATNLASLGATTTVHVGPSGTTTVVEYKSGTNFNLSPRTQVPSSLSSPQRSPSQNSIITTPSSASSSSSSSASSTPSSINSLASSSASTPPHHHQHFHKKYLREQMNGFDQNNFNNNNNNSNINNNNNNNNNNIKINENGNEFNVISPTKTIHHQQTILVQDPDEYHHRTPIKVVPINYSYNDDSIKDPSIQYENSSNASIVSGDNNGGRSSSQKSVPSSKQKHPTNLPYDPMVHTTNKPPYSFSSLIFMAIEDSPEKALPVKEIYAWIVQHFPYFKTAPTGWKNSVRHNLSLNKSFLKVEKAPNMGKGSLWRVEQQQRPNLIQALARSPFFPCSAVDKMSPYKSPTSPPRMAESPPMTPIKSTLDARLFPKLSKMIKEMVTKGNYTNGGSDTILETNEETYIYNNNNGEYLTNGGGSVITQNGDSNNLITKYENVERLARDCGADSIDDVNAATAMLALKHGPKVFTENFHNGSPVITSSPSEDHTYSAGGGVGGGSTSSGGHSQNVSDNNSNGASSDAAYESSEECHNITAAELEERRRHAEGVDALLSFASKVSSMSSSATSSPAKRPASTSIDDEHISSYMENIPNLQTITDGHIIINEDDGIMNDGTTIIYQSRHHNHYDTPQNYYHHLSSPSPAKKLKPPRNLRTKLKRKAWIR